MLFIFLPSLSLKLFNIKLTPLTIFVLKNAFGCITGALATCTAKTSEAVAPKPNQDTNNTEAYSCNITETDISSQTVCAMPPLLWTEYFRLVSSKRATHEGFAGASSIKAGEDYEVIEVASKSEYTEGNFVVA